MATLGTGSLTTSPIHLGSDGGLVAAFTNAYLNIMQELISYETPGQAVFGNKGNLVEWGKGVTATFPTRKPARRGIVGDITNRVGRIPRGGNPTYSMAQFEAMTHRLAINFDWNAMNTASNERYVANLVKNALSDVKQQWNRRQNIWLYGGEISNPNRDSLKNGDTTVIQTMCDANSNTIGDGCVAVVCATLAAGNKDLKVRLPISFGEVAGDQLTETGTVQAGAQWLEPGDYISIVNLTTGLAEYAQISSITRNYATKNSGDVGPTVGADGFATLTLASVTRANHAAYQWGGSDGDDEDDEGSIIHLASPDAVSDAVITLATATPTQLQDSDISGAYPGFGSITGPMHKNKTSDFAGGVGVRPYLGVTNDQYWSSEVLNFSNFAGSGDNKFLSMDFLVLDRVLHQIKALHHRRPDCLFMNPQVWMEWVSESHTNHAFRNAGSITPRPGKRGDPGDSGAGVPVNLTYESIEAVTGVGTMQVIVDPYCPAYTMYAVNKGDVGYMERFPMSMATDDGSEFRFPSESLDKLEAFMRVVSTFVALHPASVNKITGIATDTPVL